MTKEEYKELNNYLNGCFMELEKMAPFLVHNLEPIARLSDATVHTLKSYDLKKTIHEGKLTFEEVYEKAKNIIQEVVPQHIPMFNPLISSGILDFSYENEYYDSNYTYYPQKDISLININRNFSYDDVCTLIHEFMHYTNGSNQKTSPNREIFTEFISIYFEEYARNYLIQSGIDKDELDINFRFVDLCDTASNYNWYSFILLAYYNNGPIDENTYQFITDNFCFIPKEAYEEECIHALKKLRAAEKKYRMDILYEHEFDEQEFSKKIASTVSKPYKYILGGVLAFYELKNCDINQIIYLNDHMNDEKMNEMDPIDLLKNLGIDLNSIEIEDLVDCMEDKIKDNCHEQVK